MYLARSNILVFLENNITMSSEGYKKRVEESEARLKASKKRTIEN